ncbi:hypothetical protein KY284_005323 [Solanum tuberosum]|nr:hypothetical protein KY284_005323 [Solanum tuberosum]
MKGGLYSGIFGEAARLLADASMRFGEPDFHRPLITPEGLVFWKIWRRGQYTWWCVNVIRRTQFNSPFGPNWRASVLNILASLIQLVGVSNGSALSSAIRRLAT